MALLGCFELIQTDRSRHTHGPLGPLGFRKNPQYPLHPKTAQVRVTITCASENHDGIGEARDPSSRAAHIYRDRRPGYSGRAATRVRSARVATSPRCAALSETPFVRGSSQCLDPRSRSGWGGFLSTGQPSTRWEPAGSLVGASRAAHSSGGQWSRSIRVDARRREQGGEAVCCIPAITPPRES